MNEDGTVLEQMEKLGDVFVTLRAELAQTMMGFRELQELETGSVIRLPRPTGENIDVYAEDVLVGWGEVLPMEGLMNVRLADLRDAILPGLQEPAESAGQRAETEGEKHDAR